MWSGKGFIPEKSARETAQYADKSNRYKLCHFALTIRAKGISKRTTDARKHNELRVFDILDMRIALPRL